MSPTINQKGLTSDAPARAPKEVAINLLPSTALRVIKDMYKVAKK